MFTTMKGDFGLATQSNSMLEAMNIESGFTTKPNSRFDFVNRDFGWRTGRPPESARWQDQRYRSQVVDPIRGVP